MKRPFSRFLLVIATTAALAGCASSPETTRSNLSLQAPRIGAISALQREFQSRTKTVVYFAFDKDLLDAEARQRLDEQAAWILDNKNIRFRVYGYTDKVGDVRYNYELGLRRANRVVEYLVSKGIARGRLEAMVSFGEESPAVDTTDRERLNRRVVTEVHGYAHTPAVTASRESGSGWQIGGRSASSTTSDGGSTTTATNTDVASNSGSGNSGPGNSGTGDSGPGNSGPGNSGPGNSGPGNSGSGNSSTDKNPNSGRGNGDEAGDPGNSGGKNNGGDEL